MSLALSTKRPKDLGKLIVVGGPGGSGSSTIARMLARHFGLHYIYGGSFMRTYAHQYGYATVSEFITSEEFIEDKSEYDRIIDSKLIRASGWRDVLIDSKTFAAISTNLQISCSVKIWLNSPIYTRVRRTLNKERQYGIKKVLSKDTEIYKLTAIRLEARYLQDKERYKALYGIDYGEQQKYNDIVLDTSPYNEGETMEIILKRIKDGKYLK